jgi:trans-aconitate methyltransferase
MTTQTERQIDWAHWRDRWETQQAVYTPDWEGRYGAMLDALEVLLPPAFTALDLACGPGTISRRILARFPEARCIALDLDPVLLTMGHGALGDAGGRLRWVEANLMDDGWADALGVEQVDAVLSSTALHWLPGPPLVALYERLGALVRPGGVVINADNMQEPSELPSFRKLNAYWKERRTSEEAIAARGVESWKAWWDALAEEPAARQLLDERARRFGWMDGINRTWEQPIFDVHVAALRNAGFREVGTIWQSLTNRVLLAVR